MSFILDALNKSESERLRKDSPAFSDLPDSTRQKSASHWIWIIVVLIGINISVLTVIYMKPDRDPVTARPSAESISDPAQAAVISDNVAEAERDQSSVAEATAVPVTRIPAAAASQSAAPTASMVSTDTSVVLETFATFNDLRAQGVLLLPDLHLDIHVYSSNPEDRFVFVNMSKYKERATLDDGPVVREITPDGVILEYLGTGFLLPRE